MLDRDINAAKNILTAGLAGLAFGESGRLGIENSMHGCFSGNTNLSEVVF